MSRLTAHILLFLSAGIAILLTIIFAANLMNEAVNIVIVAWVVVYLILIQFLRCKHCGKLPGRGEFFHNYCPYCGEPLD
jgi:hypothetical protein